MQELDVTENFYAVYLHLAVILLRGSVLQWNHQLLPLKTSTSALGVQPPSQNSYVGTKVSYLKETIVGTSCNN